MFAMLKGKQKRFLRALGTGIDPILQIGKAGITDNTVKQLDDALEARELVKVRVLPNSGQEVKEVAEALKDKVNAELVQVIGNNFLLYRKSKEKPKIELPL
ncbi:MAG: RNA-binding protein [Clostridia bacterium]|nr:putative RNA-binding protein YhbY family [Clostridiales bacterium]MDK2984488.1 RNA-binding protein [Clostridia bacterium]